MSKLSDEIEAGLESADNLLALAEEQIGEPRQFADTLLTANVHVTMLVTKAHKLSPSLTKNGALSLISEREERITELFLRAISGD